ncbi:hypothetical protein EON82_00900 [bacterium]|nr:MAG: hypothetical protein EON82_00900 [bacterium]
MICSNCDREFKGGYCPQCGRPVVHFSGKGGAIALLVLLVLPSAFVGACSLHEGITFDRAKSGAPLGELAIRVGLFAFFACGKSLFWVWKLWRN